LLKAHSRKCFVDSQCANSDAQLLAHLKFICPTPSQASFRCTTVSTSKKNFFFCRLSVFCRLPVRKFGCTTVSASQIYLSDSQSDKF